MTARHWSDPEPRTSLPVPTEHINVILELRFPSEYFSRDVLAIILYAVLCCPVLATFPAYRHLRFHCPHKPSLYLYIRGVSTF
jgi:hypothetical protein